MTKLHAMVATLAVALGLAGCGSAATGITVEIDPDPVEAVAQRDGSFVASWDAVVSDLTGVGGTVQSVETELTGASSVSGLAVNPANPGQPSPSTAVAPFARRMFHQSAQFRPTAGQSVSVEVTVRFQADDGQAYQATATARVTLR